MQVQRIDISALSRPLALTATIHVCQFLISMVINCSHSHVYGLHRPICAQETRQENQCNEASRPLKELSVVST
jgi:hypothetical protein